MSSGCFVLAFTNLTHESEPRSEMQDESSQRSANYLSYQSQRRDVRQTAQRAAELIRGTAVLLCTRVLDFFSFNGAEI